MSIQGSEFRGFQALNPGITLPEFKSPLCNLLTTHESPEHPTSKRGKITVPPTSCRSECDNRCGDLAAWAQYSVSLTCKVITRVSFASPAVTTFPQAQYHLLPVTQNLVPRPLTSPLPIAIQFCPVLLVLPLKCFSNPHPPNQHPHLLSLTPLHCLCDLPTSCLVIFPEATLLCL